MACKTATRAQLIVRFWSKVNKDGPIPEHKPQLGPCWLWTASTNTRGYGGFRHAGILIMAHRFAHELRFGTIPAGKSVCHHCDTPACVRHTFSATQAQNLADCRRKGRIYTKVTDEQVA